MIKNDKQLAVAVRKTSGLEAARDQLDPSDKAAWNSYTDLINHAIAEMSEYHDIKEGFRSEFPLTCLDDLGGALIKSRVCRGWTQKEFADSVGVSEQQVQRDEARDYENAGLARMAELLDVLGMELVGVVRPKGTSEAIAQDGISFSNHVAAGSVPGLWGRSADWDASATRGEFTFSVGQQNTRNLAALVRLLRSRDAHAEGAERK